ncbi:flagellar motor protein MotB [Polystyrenella longa]|uniref:Flagellar motor protein MotB n=1 Tax=Polystyrenella longa TaxID=2528007 RepID=A0A518CP49_9PLAN|nr:flagellar motor protein MotB [Polystyrenella longa]QDU81006.1 flagellar motor protein MotB [Polystyrenella longa]
MEDDGPPGVPEWVVTYGDMMSLLLTFFIMLVSLSEVVAEDKYRAILEALQSYVGYDFAPANPPGKSFPHNSMLEKMTKLGSWKDKSKDNGGLRRKSTSGEDLRVFRNREGKVILVGEPIYFEGNKESLAESEILKLRTIADELKGKPNKIEIRSHCSESIPDKEKRNLCYRRGRFIYDSLVRVLEIEPDRIRIGAAGSTMPMEKKQFDTNENRNRVEVLILDTFSDEYVGPRE